jgi:iron(III) transport system substrate-binding protein
MRVSHKRRAGLALLAITALGVTAGCGSDDSSKSSPALATSLSAACQKGASEGTVDYWVSYDADTFKEELAPFESENPKIKVVQTQYHGTDITPKVSAEAQAGHTPTADLVEADVPSLVPIINAKLVDDVDWTQFGLPSDQLSGGSGIQGIRTYRVPAGIAYNTSLVQPSDLPETWEGLVDSKWSGQVIYDPRGDYLHNLAIPWGVDKATSWFKDFLSTDKPVAVEGSTSSLQQVASGQSKISTSATADNIAQLSATGAPLAIKYLDIVPTLDYYAYIVKGAQHPNAAACFMSWWAGPEGTAQRVKYESKPNDTVPQGIPAGSTVVSLTNEADGDTATKFATEIATDSAQ